MKQPRLESQDQIFHVTAWLPAYHDGELSGPRQAEVEAHLATCAGCLAELEALEGLSALLQSAPLPALAPRPCQLPPRLHGAFQSFDLARARRNWGRLAWQSIPVGLALAWVFLQGAIWALGWVDLPLQAGRGPDLGLLSGALRYALPGLPFVDLPDLDGPLFEQAFLAARSLGASLLIGGLLGGWLAGWWATEKSTTNR